MERKPKAFMSYARADDQNDGQKLTQLRQLLEREIRSQTGEEFSIFQDTEDIKWGEEFDERIEDALNEVTFFMPIITPSFFGSKYCRKELCLFYNYEKQIGNDRLILPIYYIECELLEDRSRQSADELAQIVVSRNYIDWRRLRFSGFTTSKVRKVIEKMALRIRDAIRSATLQNQPNNKEGQSTDTSEEDTGLPKYQRERNRFLSDLQTKKGRDLYRQAEKLLFTRIPHIANQIVNQSNREGISIQEEVNLLYLSVEKNRESKQQDLVNAMLTDAKEYLDLSIERGYQHTRVYFWLAIINDIENNLEEARDNCEKSIELGKDFAAAYWLLIKICKVLRSYERLREEAESCIADCIHELRRLKENVSNQGDPL